ncbi:MAG: right-handed parallel beta-helix repeat-containing protein [Candidatus Micrarchaeota archaeon]|nr:right-handed parallel beta-helix repeat-containing protein [Candidatus Micrarchaeota archaeon]
MRLKILPFIVALLFYISLVRAPIPIGQIDGCANIDLSGQFFLGSDLVGANVTPTHLLTTACILVSEPNVEFDCLGHTITNDVSGNTTGILLDSRNSTPLTNITIKNCRVSNYTWDIYVYNSTESIISNNTANLSVNIGFTVDNSSYINVTNNTAYNNPGDGFTVNGSSYSIIANNIVRNSSNGFISHIDSFENSFTSNNATNTSAAFYLYRTYNNTFTNNTAGDNTWGFYIYNSSSNNLTNNTAYGNADGFWIQISSDYNVLINNTARGNDNDGFDVQNSSYNNFTANTASNNSDSGIALYWSSNFNSLDGNIALANDWNGFYISSSFNNTLTNNTAYGTSEFGFNLFLSYGNNLTNNTAQESGEFDLFIDPFFWNFLNVSSANDIYCNNIVENLTGSGGRPINYTNVSVNWNDITASEILLCNADNSNLTNVTIQGSDTLYNNGLIMSRTSNTVVDSSNSSDNFIGFATLFSPDNNFTNNIADNNWGAGFADFFGAGNRFANNLQSRSTQGGFFILASNDSVYINNTAYGNFMAGFAILDYSNNTQLTNNTVYNTSQAGVMVGESDFTMITGDHYYNNDVDFAVNTDTMLAPLNLSEVIFDNPLGNFQNYTNLSINDIVQPNDSYAITWSSQPAPTPFTKSNFGNKFINILATPEVVIENIIWHWTDAEAAGHSAGNLGVMRYNNYNWMTAPGQSMLNPIMNYLSISNLNEFGVFGMFEFTGLPAYTGGGGASCTNTLKISVVSTLCPDNKVVVQVDKSDGTPVKAGEMVTIQGGMQTYTEHTDSNGQVTLTIPISGSYNVHAVSGYYCGDYTLQYIACSITPAGCSSNVACADDQYCDSSTGACKPVGCPCGELYAHQCHPYACCVDSDCNSNYTCVDHQCTAAVKPECNINDDCKYNEYCSNGKCLQVQTGKCGRISNHAWKDYECCNNSDCQSSVVCKDHTCTQVYTITTNPTGPIGESHQIKVMPAGAYNLSVVTPDGNTKTVQTDQNGNAAFVLENGGTYLVYLIKDETTKASVEVNAVNNTSAVKPATGEQQNFLYIILIVVILLVALIAAVLLLSRRGRRRY